MRQYPNKMQKHRYAETIRTILLHASTLKNQNNEDVPVHMYKVAAHTGVLGNEEADALAKFACTNADEVTQIVELPENVAESVVVNQEGRKMYMHGVDEQIKSVELKEAKQDYAYTSNWNKELDDGTTMLDQEISTGFLRKPEFSTAGDGKWSTLRRLRQCKAGTLLTAKQRFMYNMQKTPFCTLCTGEHWGDVTHTLGGCSNKILHSQHNKRHDEAVRKIHTAMEKGYKGALKILFDPGGQLVVVPANEKVDNTDEAVDKTAPSRQTLPQYLFKKPVDLKNIQRPDLVMICKLRAKGTIPGVFVPPRKNEDNTIHIVEVSYTYLANIQARYRYKHAKYQALIEELCSLGWDPVLHVIILGTLGEIPRQVAELLQAVGVKDKIRDSLLKDLHENAITWMDKCIDTELALNLASNHQHGFARHKRRKKQA